MLVSSKPDLTMRLVTSFTVPGKPMGKQRARVNTTTGTVYTPDKTARYENLVALAGQEAMRSQPPVTGPLDVTVILAMPIAISWPKKKQSLAAAGRIFPTGKPDLDNAAKLLDGLNMVVWADDSQIVDLTVQKRYSDTPGMAVVVYELIA